MMIAWMTIELEVRNFAQADALFRKTKMDVDLGEWLDWSPEVRDLKIEHAEGVAKTMRSL